MDKPKGAKPCPFCGGTSLRYANTEDGDKAVCCNDCLASVVGYHTKAAALRKWNNRKEPRHAD